MSARWLSTFLAIALCTACGGGDDTPRTTSRAVTPIDPATTGIIRGTVRFEGTPPKQSELALRSFPGCTPPGTGPVLAGDVLVRDGRVQNAFAWIKDGLGGRVFAVPPTPVEVDQAGCMYTPRVVGVQVGQPLIFKNSDEILHNVRSKPGQSSGFNLSLGVRGASRTLSIDQAEVMVPIRCDVHPWMQAFVGVVDHPYFAVTGPDGTFTLVNVPAGTYTVGVWSERLGSVQTTVTVTAGGTADVPVTLPGA